MHVDAIHACAIHSDELVVGHHIITVCIARLVLELPVLVDHVVDFKHQKWRLFCNLQANISIVGVLGHSPGQ